MPFISGGGLTAGLDPTVFLARTGGTMIGPLYLRAGDPITDREAVPLGFLEDQLQAHQDAIQISLIMPAEFLVTGSPAGFDGTFTVEWEETHANWVLAGPADPADPDAPPAFRHLVGDDISDLHIHLADYLPLTGGALTGPLSVAGNVNITGTPAPQFQVNGVALVTGVSSVFGRTGAVTAANGDYTAAQVTNAVSTIASYADPAWLTNLAWSKLTGAAPITTKGDVMVYGTAVTRLPVGSNDQAIVADSATTIGLKYASVCLNPWTANVSTDGFTLTSGTTANNLIFATGTAAAPTERMRITSAGLVGIGTAAPVAKLQVTNQLTTPESYVMRIQSIGSTTPGLSNSLINFHGNISAGQVRDWVIGMGNATFFGDHDNFGIRDLYGQTTFCIVRGSGRVGIQTSNPAATLDPYNMDANGTPLILARYPADGNFWLQTRNANSTTPTVDAETTRLGLYYGSSSGYNAGIRFFRGTDSTNGYLVFDTAGGEKWRINANGCLLQAGGPAASNQALYIWKNVGSDPDNLIPIIATFYGRSTTGANGDSNALIQFSHFNGSNSRSWIMGTGSTTRFGNVDNWGLQDTWSNVFLVVDRNNGNLGLGTRFPNATLTIGDATEPSSRSFLLVGNRAVNASEPDPLTTNQIIMVSNQTDSYIAFRTGSRLRWLFAKSNSAETGGNEGSDFIFNKYQDSGTHSATLSPVMYIKRSTGNIGIGSVYTAQNFPTHQLTLSLDSAAKPSTNTWTIASDKRTKRNVRRFDGGMDVVRELKPTVAEYNGKCGTPNGARVVSFDSDELRKVVPEAVTRVRAKLEPEDKEEVDMDGINTHEIFFHLLQAVKQIDKRLQRLEALRDI